MSSTQERLAYYNSMLNDLIAGMELYKPELQIDRQDLDGECAKQADLYFRVSEQAAEAASWRDKVKSDLAYLEADLAQTMRLENQEAKGRDRITEAAVKEAITLDKDVAALQRNLIAWERASREWYALQTSIDLKGRMLRDLTTLYTGGYFTVTSTGGVQHELKTEAAARSRNLLNEARQRDYPMPDRRK